MGINDRDYQRNYYPESGFELKAPSTVTTRLVLVMIAVYIVQVITKPDSPIPTDVGWFTDTFGLSSDVFKHPLHLFQLLTYGFLHAPDDVKHIVGNMITFWFLGQAVEQHYGKREYLAFFLTSIVAAGFVWVLGEFVAHRGFTDGARVLGASGAVVAVVILFALNFPTRMVLFMFFVPMPVWVLAMLWVAYDIIGAIQRSGTTAFTCHLGGALFAYVYYKAGWRLESLLPGGNFLKRLKPKPKLRLHTPETSDETTEEIVDKILKKIQDHGRDSLTAGERRILEEASREYQKRRR
jgi:membrane associated rhomboid family serine protease